MCDGLFWFEYVVFATFIYVLTMSNAHCTVHDSQPHPQQKQTIAQDPYKIKNFPCDHTANQSAKQKKSEQELRIK